MDTLKRIIKNNRFLVNLYRFLYKLVATIYWNIVFIVDKVFDLNFEYANCFVFTSPLGKLKKNNWGDDLNYYLFNSIITKKIQFVPFDQLFFAPKIIRFSLIGSIIGDFNLDNTIIYGSGSISPNPIIRGCPVKVLSVRGPLTREVLRNNGIECPEVYGDPALLTALFYKPIVTRSNKIGIIPHYRTLNTNWMENDWIAKLSASNEIVIIDLSKYEKWTDVIDCICGCKFVLSESLHGLIIAESYSIPSVWVEIQQHNMPWEWDFKFNDFYKSIRKSDETCLKLFDTNSIEEILERVNKWKPGIINYDAMLKVFPFEIKDRLRK